MGTYYAIAYRSIMYIPMAAIGSGGSFGFFMGIGMIMRTEMQGIDMQDHYTSSPYEVKTFYPQTGDIKECSIYKKYIV